MENRRLLLAAFLSALILIIWNAIFPPVRPASPESPKNQATNESISGGNRIGEVGSDTPLTPEGVGAVEGVEASSDLLNFGQESVAAAEETITTLENENVRADFSNRGGQLISLHLKGELTSDGQPIEMVRDRGTDLFPYALLTGGVKSHPTNKALFVGEELEEDGSPAVTFRHGSSLGQAEKKFVLHPDGFISAEITIAGEKGWSVLLGPGLRNLSEKELGDRFVERGVGYRRESQIEFLKAGKEDEDTFLSSTGLRWVSLEDNFFLVATLPDEGIGEVIVRPVAQRIETRQGQPRFLPAGTDEENLADAQLLLFGSSGEQLKMRTLFSAKRYSELAQLPYGLEETVRFGWLGVIAKPIYFGLRWIYANWVPNYGWAIILVTCFIKIAFFPLTFKSQASMAKMQELNPKVQAIRTKYKSKLKDKQGRPNLDAQKQMNEEVMGVYKNAGVNPASGCLPVLLQMPVFFALFKVLSTAVELRNAPWLGWIQDLSVPDPYFILPILMGITSVLMQRMMPSSPDPVQRRMLQLMPIMFTFFAFAFPSGLLLYWVTNNLLSMVQQSLLLKKKDAEPSN